jgi:3',5'-cyclic AMP phosphodiesterase CpdA
VVDTAAALERCIAQLNAFRPRPALVVISGDLADTGAVEEYAHLMRLLQPLELELVVIPGNHDARAPLRHVFPEQPYACGDGPMHFARALEALDLIFLDSTVPGESHGMLDAAALAWLETTLASAPARPAILFLHHPPFATGIAHMDRQNLRNASALAAIIERHRRVRLIAAGHVHRAVLTSFAGRAATICPAPNHAVALDLNAARVPSLTIEPPAFHLHAWLPGGDFGDIVTHFVPLESFAGPYPFFDPTGRQL